MAQKVFQSAFRKAVEGAVPGENSWRRGRWKELKCGLGGKKRERELKKMIEILWEEDHQLWRQKGLEKQEGGIYKNRRVKEGKTRIGL